MMTAAIFGTFFILILLGVPIALSLLLGAFVPLAIYTSVPWDVIMQKMFTAIDSFSLLALPFFIITGGLLDKGGISKRLINFANSLVGWLPGGLAVVTFLASAFFGAICGSASATVVAIGAIMIPAMLKEGYPLKFALATCASAGWLGIVIPPSIPMILYAISGNVSVGKVFMGGFIPGFLLAAGMSIYSIWYGKKHLNVRLTQFSIRNVGKCFIDAIWALIMPTIVLGGIYGGIFTPTEAAAVAALYGVTVGMFVYKELTIPDLKKILQSSILTSSMILFIIGTASIFAYMMVIADIPTEVANFITSVAHSQGMFLFVVTVILFITGMIMETAPAILILTPILTPMLPLYNVDPVAFGVIMIINLGIGVITPPVGLTLYVTATIANAKIETVVNRHLVMYIGIAVSLLIIFMIFPQIIMYLPNLMTK